MKSKAATLAITLFVLVSFKVLYGQDGNTLLQAAIVFSDSLAGKDMQLFNGRVYTPEHSRAKGYPFLGTSEWKTGMVMYSRQTYVPVELLYDVFRDQLLILDRSDDGSVNYLVLNPEMTDRFRMDGQDFINLGYANRLADEQERGYYELLYEGKASLVVRWTKTFDDARSQKTPFGGYREEKRSRYIWHGQALHRVTNRNSLLRILGDQRDAIRKYLDENNINITLATDEEITRALKRYDELSE